MTSESPQASGARLAGVAPAQTMGATRTLGLSWPLLVGVIAWVGVLTLRSPRVMLADPGTFWHPATGRWIIEHGMLPTGDPFSFSMPGAPWTVQAWLSDVLFALTHALGGWSLAVALIATCFALTLALMTRFLVARMEPIHALLFVTLSAGLMVTHLLARPHVLTWPLMALWVGVLLSASEAARRPPFWLLPVMVLWANLHGGFTLGLALAGAIALDAVMSRPAAQRRHAAGQWSLFLALSVLASMVTPYGWKGLWFTFDLMQQKHALSVLDEWKAPDMRHMVGLELWLLVGAALAWTGRLRLPVLRMLPLLGLMHLALTSARSMSLLGLVAPYLMAAPFAKHWYGAEPNDRASQASGVDHWFRALAAPAHPIGAIAAMILAAALGTAVLRANPPMPLPQLAPDAALAAARAADVQGAVFNDLRFGGYLIHQGVPVFIDDRADMYGDTFLKRFTDAAFLSEPQALAALLTDYRIGWTLFPKGAPVNAVLAVLPGWRQVHSVDKYAVVYMREANDAAR